MEHTPLKKIQDRYHLEMLRLQLEREAQETESVLRQAKFDLRQAQQEQVLYSGSFRAFRDKLTGKRELAETALRHAVQKAEAALSAAELEKDRLVTQLADVQNQAAELPAWEALQPQAESEELRLWCRLEALYCIEVLTEPLETNRELLVERRDQFNGSNAGQIKTLDTLARIYTAPEAAGEACKPWFSRLTAALDALNIPFQLYPYFDAPTAFLSSATQYTRMDRINTAISQVEAMQRLLPKLRQELEVTS